MEGARRRSSAITDGAIADVRTARLHSVLVVEDEPGVRDALRLILEPHFRVLTADQGEQALTILEQERISVMTLDLRMPGWGGPETLFKIRETDLDLQVVIVTAYASYTEAMRALRLRAFDVVSKPFDANDILEKVSRAASRCETGLPGASSLEILDGFSTGLIGSIHGLSANEIQSLTNARKVKLVDLQARAQNLFGRLSSH